MTGTIAITRFMGNDGPAKFVSPSTIVPALIAYGASIRLEGPKGRRELPLQKFYVTPKTEDEREHDLKPNEILTEIIVPRPDGWKVAHYEVRQKAAFDWPLAVAAVALKLDGSNVQVAARRFGLCRADALAVTGSRIGAERAKH